LNSSNRKRLNKDQDIQILSKCEKTTKNEYLDAIKSFNNSNATNLTTFTKLIYNGVYFSSSIFRTKRCDSAFISKTGNKGLIEKFIKINDRIHVLARKIVFTFYPFCSKTYPILKSELNFCVVSNEYFLEEIVKIKKVLDFNKTG
jgi:hypothetical protein